MNELEPLIGREESMVTVLDRVRLTVGRFQPTRVGAYHVTCSDEAEWECADAFQRWFAERMLPGLKPGSRAPFRSINLGGRYEPGALAVAESHYAASGSDGITVIVAKINAHVGVVETSEGVRFGHFPRYGQESTCCGALTAALSDEAPIPASAELRETLGRTRLAALNDGETVPPDLRLLFAAVANARLQSRRAVEELTTLPAHTPTHFLVVAGVSINRPGPDTELLVSVDHIDRTDVAAKHATIGLDDDPAAYKVSVDLGRLVLADAQFQPPGFAMHAEIQLSRTPSSDTAAVSDGDPDDPASLTEPLPEIDDAQSQAE
ncbi:MAG: hypothetical protein D6741_03450 [Planctomycetota bacterium]|nr:MAG: hypothetical protein D6741_03450 [Planctomycetota bacterium]